MDENFDTPEWKKYFEGKPPEEIGEIKRLLGRQREENYRSPADQMEKAARGPRKCPECSEIVSKQAIFCKRCGCRLPVASAESHEQLLEKEAQENPNTIFMIVSFFIPIAGFILGLVYFMKYGVENRRTAKICLGWAFAGSFTWMLLWIGSVIELSKL